MSKGNFDNLPVPIPRPIGPEGLGNVDARNTGSAETGGAGVWEYWRLVKQGKYWLLGLGLLGAVIGFIVLLQEQPIYRATTTLELQGFNETFMGMNAVDPQAGAGNYSVNAFNINTQIKIIESASVRYPVMERLGRETTPVVPPARTTMDKIRQRLRRTPMDPLREMQNGLGMAAFSLHAKPVTGTRIISITCNSTIPEIASNFVNTLAQEYVAQNSQQRSTTTQKTSQWLESQLEETKVKLGEAENRLEAFVTKTGVVFGGEVDTQNVLTSAKLRSLTAELAAIQQERIAKEAKFNAVNDMLKKGTPDLIPEIRDSAFLRTLDTQLTDAKRQYADLTLKYTNTNPKVIPIQRQIDDLQGQAQRERDSIVQRIRNDYEGAMARENGLKKAYSAEAASATGQQDKAAQYGMLKREVGMYTQTLNAMLSQVNQASVVSAVPANNVRVLDIAWAAGMPFAPDTATYIGVGAGLGILAGFGLVFLLERNKKQKSTLRFGAPGYAPSVLSVPELGVIPSGNFEMGNDMRPVGKRKWRRIKAPAVTVVAADGGNGGGLALSGWQGRPSLLVESFRLTMTSLMLMFRNAPRVLVVTSPGPGEGKTTISANLAMAMAEAGKKVLIIDMDLRRPTLHTLFNLPNDRGFIDLVRGEDMPLRITENHPTILRTPYPRVSVLPSGHIEINDIGEVFHSPRVAGLLRQLRECFDTVIIDTPPMLQFSESRLTASLADGVLLVLRSGHTDKDSAVAAREQLAHDRIELLGTILNDWDPKQSGSNSKYGSYYASYMRYHLNKGA